MHHFNSIYGLVDNYCLKYPKINYPSQRKLPFKSKTLISTLTFLISPQINRKFTFSLQWIQYSNLTSGFFRIKTKQVNTFMTWTIHVNQKIIKHLTNFVWIKWRVEFYIYKFSFLYRTYRDKLRISLERIICTFVILFLFWLSVRRIN